MNFTERSVISIQSSTISAHYNNAETVSREPVVESKMEYRVVDEAGKTVSIPFATKSRLGHSSDQVRVRVRDLVRGLQGMASSQLAWLDDLGDDPIVLTRDFYEVFVTCQQIRRSA
ncbi:MAG: hypothetical protein MUC43_07035 [Pirellula sp.]|jgi:hypothetical protein|nr:hypothetical protein [Pirellula sp.]